MIYCRRCDNSNIDFQNFCKELDEEFRLRYPETQHKFERYNKVDQSARVVVVYDDGSAIGCGCFRPFSDSNVIEIKRMYVIPERRGSGIARKVLSELEMWASEEGFKESVLETGVKQPEAIALYTASGYLKIPNYPPYVDVIESVCMKKELPDSRYNKPLA